MLVPCSSLDNCTQLLHYSCMSNLPVASCTQPAVTFGKCDCALQRGETRPEVWEAVLGCVVQLTTHSGYTVRAFLDGISQKVVAALLHCCVQHCWSQEVYCQLIRIAVNLLYVPMPSPASSDDDDDNFGGVTQGWLSPVQASCLKQSSMSTLQRQFAGSVTYTW